MSIELPGIALGIEIPNPTFSIPQATATLAAGWTATGATTQKGIYSSLPRNAHARGQYYARSGPGSITVVSGPSVPLKGIANVATKFSALIWCKCVGSSFNVKIKFYSDTDSFLGHTTLASFVAKADWTAFFLESSNITPPANSNHVRMELYATGTNVSFSLLFACLGLWDGSADGYKELTDHLRGETYGGPVSSRKAISNNVGGRDYDDQSRYGVPEFASLICDYMPEVDADLFRRAFHYAQGTPIDNDSAVNPGGGRYPLLFRCDYSTMLNAGLWDIDAAKDPLRQAEKHFKESGRNYSGVIPLLERLGV